MGPVARNMSFELFYRPDAHFSSSWIAASTTAQCAPRLKPIAEQRRGSLESVAPISDLITGTVLYNKMVEDIVSGETDLTLTEHRILFLLEHIDGTKARIRMLADGLVLSSSTVSDAVKLLEQRGLVRKVECGNDLKAVWVAPTDRGRALLSHCNDVILAETQEYWDVVGTAVSDTYFENGRRLIERSEPRIASALNEPGPVFYSFISRRYLLSYVSWFKSTYNLSLIDVRVLMLLLERGKRLTCTEIAHLLRISNSAVSNAVRRLGRLRRYIDRMPGKSLHEVVIDLTDEGRERILEIRARFAQFNQEQFGMTAEEFQSMLRTVQPRRRKSYLQRVFGESFADS